MKTTLTIQESAELIKRGVKRNKASGTYVGRMEHSSEGSFPDPESVEPLFTLDDLLSLLPKTINNGNHYLDLSYGFGDWTASYILWDNCDEGTYIRDTQGEKTADELVDALYKLLLWAIDHNHVKLD